MTIPHAPDVPASWFNRPDGSSGAHGIHGVAHTLRVWTHTQEIAGALGLAEWQVEALHYAALWHDIGRTHDGADYYHGAKSAGKVQGMGLHAGGFERAFIGIHQDAWTEPDADLCFSLGECPFGTGRHRCSGNDRMPCKIRRGFGAAVLLQVGRRCTDDTAHLADANCPQRRIGQWTNADADIKTFLRQVDYAIDEQR